MDLGTLFSIGLALVFVGVILIVIVAVLILISGSKGKRNVRGGGAIIIGPVPIIFGTDKKSVKTILILSIALTVLLIVLYVILNFVS
jgi:uncharacterized protein (TIGR00304 family)